MTSRNIALIGSREKIGTSFVSINLAVNLAKESKKKVALIELTSKKINSSDLLGIPNKTLFELLPNKDILDNNILKGYLSKHNSNIEYLNISFEDIPFFAGTILPLLGEIYQFILIDIGNYLNEDVVKIIESAHLLLSVITPDVQAVEGEKRIVGFLYKYHFPANILKNVINGHNGSDEYFAGLTMPVILKIPDNKEQVTASFNKKIPLVELFPHSSISKSLMEFSSLVIENNDLFVKTTGRFISAANETAGKTDEKEIKNTVHKKLVSELKEKYPQFKDAHSFTVSMELKEKVQEIADEIFAGEAKDVKMLSDRNRLMNEIMDETLGLGPLEDFLRDDKITEIMVNGIRQIYIEKNGKLFLTGKSFDSEKQLFSVIERIITPLGRRIDESVPYVDARLPDGSRVNAIIPPLAIDGAVLTIRKFSKEKLTIENLVSIGAITNNISEFLRVCVLLRKNIVISGGTGSGKTTFLNILASFIEDGDRIVTIEDSAELNLPQKHVVRLETRPANVEGKGAVAIRDLVRNALRMRPDRIVVGECRGAEALDMLQAMNTGHDGSLTTLHSNSPRDTLSRLETMVLMAGMDLPLRAIREQIVSAVDFIVHQSRFKDGSRKITHVTEVVGMEGDIITAQDIFLFKQKSIDPAGKVIGDFSPTGIVPDFIRDLDSYKIKLNREIFAPV